MIFFKPLSIIIGVTTLIASCGSPSSDSLLKEAWNQRNDPIIMVKDFEAKFDQLALQGALTHKVWSGDYWATNRGGISYRWNSDQWGAARYAYDLVNINGLESVDLTHLSPSEKYDLYIGAKDFPLTRYERERTEILKTVSGNPSFVEGFEIPGWFGICHAWAPATIHFDEPAAVEVTNKEGIKIPFGSSDIKALLSYFVHFDQNALGGPSQNMTYFLADRCNQDFGKLRNDFMYGKITKEIYEAKINSMPCRDVNAGAFHIVLANQISKMNQGFVADVTRDAEVWNQGVVAYRSTILLDNEGATAGAAPGTVREIIVDTEMDYITEIDNSWERPLFPNQIRTKYYEYRLELNANGEIIGGEWLSDERPDFLWKQTIPEFYGFFAPLKEIYEASKQ